MLTLGLRRHAAKIPLSALVVFCALALSATASFADNPIVQTSYTADPAPMLSNGVLYLYTSHDDDVTVNDFFTMNDWRLYSTTDMVNWTDLGSPAGWKTYSWGTGDAWAVQAIPRNNKFYLYTPINNSTGSKIGVLVGNNPWGPFTDPLGKALISTGSGNIDPTVFIDDDGQAYLYWGNPQLYYVKLNADMTSFSGSPNAVNLTTAGFGVRTKTDRATAYEEGPWFYKRNSLYYIVYPADSTPEKISYTTSNGPTGPWMYRGDIMAKESGTGSSFTNHPGVIDYKGHSYFFYHNGALPGGGGYKRSVCVEEFTYGTDGSIPMIKMTTAGPAAVDTLNPYQQVEAETIAFSSGLKTEVCTDTGGGMNVTSISNGDYIKVKNVDFGDGPTAFDARVTGAGSNAKIELHLESEAGTSLGTCDVSGASTWTTKNCTVSGTTGKHDLFLKFTGGSGDLFKFNWWKFTPKNPTMDGGPPDGGATDAGVGGRAGSGGSGAGGAGGRATDAGADGSGTGGTSGSGGTKGGSGGQPIGTGGGSGGAQVGSGGSGGQIATGSGGKATATGGITSSTGGASTGSGGQGSGGLSGATGGAGSNATARDGGCACRVGTRQADSIAGAVLFLAALLLRMRRPDGPRSR